MPQGIFRQYLNSYILTNNNHILLTQRQPSLLQLPKVERKYVKSCKASGSQILGSAFHPNNRLVPIKGKREEKVKVLNPEKEAFVLKEDASVQTDRLVENNTKLIFKVPFVLYNY